MRVTIKSDAWFAATASPPDKAQPLRQVRGRSEGVGDARSSKNAPQRSTPGFGGKQITPSPPLDARADPLSARRRRICRRAGRDACSRAGCIWCRRAKPVHRDEARVSSSVYRTLARDQGPVIAAVQVAVAQEADMQYRVEAGQGRTASELRWTGVSSRRCRDGD